MQTDLYNGCKTVVVVVPAETALLHRFGGENHVMHTVYVGPNLYRDFTAVMRTVK